METDRAKPDLIIVGGGLAGLTAGVRAAELGLRPVVLEQGDGEDYPCNSRQSGGILHIGFHDPLRPSDQLVDVIERLTGGNAKPELARILAMTGARLITWLQGHGTRFMRFNAQEGYRWCMSPPRALRAGVDWRERGPDMVMRQLARILVAKGGTLQLRARAQKLMIEGGRCVGIRGELDGQQTEWRAPYCLLADGGFQANRALVEKFIGPHFDALFQRGAASGRGDGLNMALRAGARLTDCRKFYGHLLCSDAKHNDGVWPYPEVDAIATAGVVVNSDGRRCADEGISGVELANNLASCTQQGQLFAVFDAAIWHGPGSSARIPANPLLERAGGTILRANTVAGLAEQMRVPADALARTLEDYNRAVEAGTLQALQPERSDTVQPHAIRELPLMAIPVLPGITYTMGGIDINAHAEVLGDDGQPIPGLFAAGAATGGLEGGSRAAYIGGLIKAGCFGLLAAERVATLEGKHFTIDVPKRGTPVNDTVREADERRAAAVMPTLPTRQGMACFPILNMLVRHGQAIAVAAALAMGAMTGIVGWSLFSWYVVPMALVLAAMTLVVILGISELVKLVTGLLMPE